MPPARSAPVHPAARRVAAVPLSRTRKRFLTRRSPDDFVPLTDSRPPRGDEDGPERKQRGTRLSDSAARRSKRGRPGARVRARDSPTDFTPKGEKEGVGSASSTSSAAVVAASCRRAAFCPLSSPSSRSSSRLCLTRRCSFPRPLHTFVISAIHPPLPSTSRRCRVLRSRVLNHCCTPPYLRASAGKFAPGHCPSSVWFLRLAKSVRGLRRSSVFAQGPAAFPLCFW